MPRKKGTTVNQSFSSQSSDKLLQILEFLAGQGQPLRLQDLSQALDMPQPTVLRYMNTLVGQGYAYKDEQTLRYTLTWKICRLSHQVTLHTGLRDIAAPFLRSLSQTFQSSACVVTRQEDELLYLDVADNPAHALGPLQHIGKKAPIHTTGSGKVLLAGMTDLQVERLAERRGLERFTPNTITEVPVLLSELGKIRKKGYALDDEECEVGIRCASAPLYDYTDQLVAAISVFGSIDALHDQRITQEVVPALLEASRQISERMGHV